MQITLAAIGRAKRSPTTDLFEQYCTRLAWPLNLKELEEKKPLPTEQLMAREAELLLDACKGADRLIALDERGKALSSPAFAQQIERWQLDGSSHIAFVIGGAAGLHPSVRKRADALISFGAMTWPHMLVRALLAEQLYRAHSILTHHPYHKE